MKRKLFDELIEGFSALRAARRGKRTLRTRAVEPRPAPSLTAGELLAVRRRLRLSRAVFARRLRTNPRTPGNWQRGRARPNAQAALLIRSVARYPDTMARLRAGAVRWLEHQTELIEL